MTQKVSGEERLAAICQALRQETLTPAQQEAEALLLAARREAEGIREQARKVAEELKQLAKKEIEKEKVLFHTSLAHAAHQVIERLKDQIEQLIFQKGLDMLVKDQFQSTGAVTTLLQSLTEMVEKEGLSKSCEVWVGSSIDKKAYLASLTNHIFSKPSEEVLRLGSFPSGIKIVIKDKHMSIEVTEESTKELLSSVLRREFRKYLFHESEGEIGKAE